MTGMRGSERQAVDQHLGAPQGRSESSLAEVVAELERLDGATLRRRWRSLVGSSLPSDLGRALALRVLVYKLQAQHLGDLEKTSLRELAAMSSPRKLTTPAAEADPAVVSHQSRSVEKLIALSSVSAKPRSLARPGTVLVREYGGVRHQVMVLDEGIAWNGKAFESLSQVALAITGTRWNGPRFFGLRDKAAKDDQGSSSRPVGHSGQGVRSSQRAPLSRQAVAPAQDRP